MRESGGVRALGNAVRTVCVSPALCGPERTATGTRRQGGGGFVVGYAGQLLSRQSPDPSAAVSATRS